MRSQRIKLLTWLIILLPTFMFAQTPKIGNIWYFGENAGLDFSNGDPTVLNNGALSSTEGVSVYSDRVSGSLKFYTNGGDFPYAGGVWNRNHQLMPNGSMTGAGGCNSSIQSALILRTPDSENLHYIFTTDCQENSFTGGFRYSVVDMNMDGGLGDVVTKGVAITGSTNESLAAVRHSNGSDYWVIVHKVNTDSFYVYHINKVGIAGVVKNKVGPFVGQYAGEISVAANGEKIALHATFSTGLFNFDAATGTISNYIDLLQPSSFGTFSPDCQLLYINDINTKQIFQFDATNTNDVAATKTLIANTGASLAGALRVGPNRRIYVTKNNSQTIDVIAQPNFRGADCNYSVDAINLGVNLAKMGLPNLPSEALGECISYPVENQPFGYAYSIGEIGANHLLLMRKNNPGNDKGKYHISYSEANTNIWNNIITNGDETTINNLKAGTEYKIKVVAVEQPDGSLYEFVDGHELAKVIAENGTSDDAVTRVSTLAKFELNVYPNPVQNKAKVDVNFGDIDQEAELAVFGINGQLVYQTTLTGVSGYQTIEIPTEQLQNGMYNISVTSENMKGNKRFVVVR